jgi:hypothetical protein
MYKLSNQQFQEILSLFFVAYKWLYCNEIVNEEKVKVKLLKIINLFFQSRVGDLEQIQLELSRLRSGELSDFRQNLSFKRIQSANK